MKCNEASPQFSAYLDGDLEPAAMEDLSEHLARCAGCRESFASLEAATAALRSLPPATTSPALRARILAAVDEADGTRVGAPAPAPAGRRVATHLIALTIGGAAAAACLLFIPGLAEGLVEPRIERVPVPAGPEVRIVEREVRVEVPVEVPVEVERVVEVERIVEVPVEVVLVEYRDLDLEAFGQALVEFGSHMSVAALTLRDLRAQQAAPGRAPSVAAQAQLAGRPAQDPHPLSAASVTVDSAPGRLTLQAQGPLRDLVPLLVNQLENPDTEVVALVERRLTSIRSAAEADPDLGPRLEEVALPSPKRSGLDRVLGRRPAEDTRSPHERWSAWWNANGELLASAGSRVRL